MTLSRADKILAHIKREMKILEIGPSYNPVVRRSEGWNVFSLDHLDAEGLRNKYSYDPVVDPNAIEEVDFIWQQGPIDSAIPESHLGTFDAVIGSHVIEHFPDILGFFHASERILKDGGLLSLAVPDKRYCFDYFQAIAMTSDVLEANANERTRHSRRTAFNATAYVVKAGGKISWGPGPTDHLAYAFDRSLKQAYDAYKAQVDPGADQYLDFHGWYFTPSSLQLICLELAALGLMSFRQVEFFDTTVGCEFFITLRKESLPQQAWVDDLRFEYLKRILLEIRQQTDFLIEGPNYLGPIGRE